MMEFRTDKKVPVCRIPITRERRDRLWDSVRAYVEGLNLVPPLSMEELRSHAEGLAREQDVDPGHLDYLMVLLNNALWWDTVASIPYERRLLLMPQCLRDPDVCPAQMDEFGLLCEECGACSIGGLQTLADELGYVVLVAEGTTLVTKLLEGGKVDAVVGVSCLSSLERSFPHMAAEAIPGLALPLHRDGCRATETDDDRVREAIQLKAPDGWKHQLDTRRVRDEVQSWFEPAFIALLLGGNPTATEAMARAWLTAGGKFWRPFLLACVYRAVAGNDGSLPASVLRLAVAVECFHKASLVHDDIEDDDDERYGAITLHRRYGVPVALNIGDLLVGEGYRLIASCGTGPDCTAQLVKAASEGHRTLCVGQGEELFGLRREQPLTSKEVLDIFRRKTAPAFGVALLLGAIAAEADDETCTTLKAFSESLGVAYQIRDDLQEYRAADEVFDHRRLRPSLLLALAGEHAEGAARPQVLNAWTSAHLTSDALRAIRHLFGELLVEEKAQQLLEHYKNESLRALNALTRAPLKSLLRRVVSRMLGGA